MVARQFEYATPCLGSHGVLAHTPPSPHSLHAVPAEVPASSPASLHTHGAHTHA